MANTHSAQLGTNKYLSVSGTALNVTTAVGYEVQVYFTTVPTSGETVLGGRWGAAGTRVWRLYYEGSSNRLRLDVSSDGSSANRVNVFVSYTPTVNTWAAIGVKWDSTDGSTRFYVNGIQQGATQASGTGGAYSTTTQFTAGYADSSAYIQGLVDDIRLWGSLGSSALISKYNQELVGNESGLVGYWKLNNNLNDSTSNGNTLTNNGSVTFSTNTPFDYAVDVSETTAASIKDAGLTSLVGGSYTFSETFITPIESLDFDFGWSNLTKSSGGTIFQRPIPFQQLYPFIGGSGWSNTLKS